LLAVASQINGVDFLVLEIYILDGKIKIFSTSIPHLFGKYFNLNILQITFNES